MFGLARGKIRGTDLLAQQGQHFVQAEHAQFLALARADRHAAAGGFLAADHQQEGHALQGLFADLVADLLVAYVGLGAQAGAAQQPRHVPGIGGVRFGDRQHHGLHRRQPGGQSAGVVLDQDAGEALQRAEQRAVQHDRALALAVFIDVIDAEALGQIHVHLQGAALPVAADGVAQHEFQLGAVERAFAGVEPIGQPHAVEGLDQRAFEQIPGGLVAHAVGGPGGQLDVHVLEAELAVDVQHQRHDGAAFGIHLRRRAVDVRIVLGEVAHAQQAVQRARGLVAMHLAELAHADRQVAVALEAVAVQQHAARTVHRLERQRAAVLGLGGEHVVAVVVPVAGDLPQAAVHHVRGVHFHVAGILLAAAHVGDQFLEHRPAARMPEHRAGRVLLEVEQVQLAPQPAVVALLGFLDALQIGIQVLLVGPGGAVDALQLFVARIAAPVGAREPGQFEVLQEARVGHVRAAAHVHVLLVEVQAQALLVRHVLDQVQLVVLAALLEDSDDLIARGDLLDDVVVPGDQLAHALLDGGQILGGEGALESDVVVEAFVDHRADYHPGGRIELLDRVADQVGTGMADDLQPFRILGRDDPQCRIAIERVAGIDQAAIHLAGQRVSGQAGADGGSNGSHAGRTVETVLRAVGQGEDDGWRGSNG